MKKFISYLLVLFLLFLVGCVDSKQPVTLSYEEPEIEMNVGETINITPTISNLTTDVYNLNYELYDDIAVVDVEGNLTAIEEGIIDIVVTIDIEPGAIAQLTITINGLENNGFKIVLDVNGGVQLENSIILFEKGQDVELPTPTREGYVFLGWYENGKLVDTIKNKDYNLVAEWESLASRIQIDYQLGEEVYLSNYVTRSELINDLIKDVQSIKGSEYTLDFFMNYDETGHGIFASAPGPKTLFSNEEMRAKWSWIIEYIKSLRIKEGLDVEGYDEFISKGTTLTASLSINLEMIAFIIGDDYSFSSGNVECKTVDHSRPEVKFGFWEAMNNHLDSIVYKKDNFKYTMLPKALKVGNVFEGWYTTSDFNESSKVTSTTSFDSNVVLYPKFAELEGNKTVELNYLGGITEQLYTQKGSKLTSITVNNYNSSLSSDKNNIYISDKQNDLKLDNSTRIYLTLNENTGLYEIVSILKQNEKSKWFYNAKYVITIPSDYEGSYDDSFQLSKINTGDIVIFDTDIKEITSSKVCNLSIYDEKIKSDVQVESFGSNYIIPNPVKVGYSFDGWFDDYGNKYESASDLLNLKQITLYAMWKYNGHITGEFEDKSWIVKGESINLITTVEGENFGQLVWESETPEIATVSQLGTVTGVSEGLAVIKVKSSEYNNVFFVFYITVFDQNPTGIVKLLVDSNNTNIYTREELIIGILNQKPAPFYADIIGSVSKLLFEDYVVHDDYYLANPANKSNLVANGIEFITFHYAADMNGNANNGGKNLATWNKNNNETGNQVSWHYGTGNDGVWACQTEAYGAWHAGSSKTMTWYNTGIEYKEGDPEFPKITLGDDTYFYLNGQKTKVVNTTTGKKLNGMGLAFKIVDGYYYLSGCYYNKDYGYIASTGGNNNSIGIESSVAKGSDLWLTWQYSAQLCANLLLKYNLPLTRLVGHHFFSGKWCPQPMLENDMEIWWEFIELVRQEMDYFKNYSDYQLSFSTQSEHIAQNGRITSLPEVSQCVTYDVTYTFGSETKTITLSTILPSTFK